MDKDKQYVAQKLFAVRKKYLNYFEESGCRILTCVAVNWEKPISMHLVNKDLPFEISCDLEEMFWIGDDKINTCKDIIAEINEQMERSKTLRDNFYRLQKDFQLSYEIRMEAIDRLRDSNIVPLTL